MNKRIRKKKQKLAEMHASKYKYVKLGEKRAHAVGIETRHCIWGLLPNKDHYSRYLLRKRRCGKLESKITQHAVSSKSFIMNCLSERKEVKEKLLLKEGNCDFERKPLPYGFVRGRIWNE